MPRVRNRTAIDGLNLRIGRTIPAHGEIEVSDEEAAELEGSPLLEVLPDPAPPAPPVDPPAPAPVPPTPEPESQELEEAEAELAQAQQHLADLKGSN